MESENNIAIEHQNVPVAHQGLHGFLYSSDDEHTSTSSAITFQNDGTEVITVEEWRSLTDKVKVAGVYAVLNRDRQTQYIGYSRDIRQSLDGHIIQNGAEVCALLRVQTFKFPKREAMESLRDEWIADLECVPPGNQGAQGIWASTVGAAVRVTMSEADRNAHEEKKLKLRKAMADSTLISELEQSDRQDEAASERQRKLEAAVKNDDWSAVVDA
jgi:hypothetical protein